MKKLSLLLIVSAGLLSCMSCSPGKKSAEELQKMSDTLSAGMALIEGKDPYGPSNFENYTYYVIPSDKAGFGDIPSEHRVVCKK